MEYEEKRSAEVRDEQKLARLPKALDGKMYILVLQTIMCVIILSVALVIKTFFTDLYNDTRIFYKENFEDVTTPNEVVSDNGVNATVSVITQSSNTVSPNNESTSSVVAAGGPYNSAKVSSNEVNSSLTINRFLSPLKSYTVSSKYGERNDPLTNEKSTHNGVDMAANFGDEIVASLSGEVEFAGYDASYGNYVIIKHSAYIKTVYAHCSKLVVKTGDSVKAGQTIALVGSTGRSTGPHLHFEVMLNGNKVNPENYIKLQ